MITSLFHKNSDLLGINIERNNGSSLVLCVAFKEKNEWKAKTMAGISGDLYDSELIDKVVLIGQYLDEKTASEIFSKAANLGLKYSLK